MIRPDGKREYVNLLDSNEAAKFLLFHLPRLGWQFVGDKPVLKLTPVVERLINIRNKLDARKASAYSADQFPDFDDDIPFAPIGLSNKSILHCM